MKLSCIFALCTILFPANASNAARGNAPSTSSAKQKPPQCADAASDEDVTIFTIDESLNMLGYLESTSECTVIAFYLSLCRSFQLHEFIAALDWENLSEPDFENLLIYSLPKMLGDPNAIDSMLSSEEDPTTHRCRDIVNKLVCLCVIARRSQEPLRRNHARQMLEEALSHIKLLYLRYLRRDIPGSDRQAYTLAFYRIRSPDCSLNEYIEREHLKKVQYYIGNDGHIYSLVFNDNSIMHDYYVCPVYVEDLIAPPPGRLAPIARVTLPGNPGAEEIRRHRMYAIPAGHVFRHMPIRSVKIFRNGTIEPNPDGYPEIPEDEDSDEQPARQAARAQQPAGRAVNAQPPEAQLQGGGNLNLTYFDYESRKPPGCRNDTVWERYNWNLPLTPDFTRYHAFGTVWYQPKKEHKLSYVENRSQQSELQKHMMTSYGCYPPMHKLAGLTPKEKRINEESIEGRDGLCVYDSFPTSVGICHEYGCMEGVPARTQEPLVCSLMDALR